MEYVLKVEPGIFTVTPYMLALRSGDLRRAAENLAPDQFPITNFLLHAMSIELGLKAAILSQDCSADMKDMLKKKIRHDLLEAHNKYKDVCGNTIFNETELNALKKINEYFKTKDLEYFSGEMISVMMNGFSSFPPLDEIRACNTKVEEMLQSNGQFSSM